MNVKKLISLVVLSSLSISAYAAPQCQSMPQCDSKESSPCMMPKNDQDSMMPCMDSCPLKKSSECSQPCSMESMSQEKNPMQDDAMACEAPCMQKKSEPCSMQEMKTEMQPTMNPVCPSGECTPAMDCNRKRSMDRDCMRASVEKLMRRCVLLIDCDFARGVMSVDVDFYRDEENAVEVLIAEYANNPEQAEEALNQIATDYVNEHGDALVANLVQGSDVTDVELIARAMRPLLQRTLMCKMLKAMHQGIIYKGKSLRDKKLQELKAQ